jgi:hypothetical protein
LWCWKRQKKPFHGWHFGILITNFILFDKCILIINLVHFNNHFSSCLDYHHILSLKSKRSYLFIFIETIFNTYMRFWFLFLLNTYDIWMGTYVLVFIKNLHLKKTKEVGRSWIVWRDFGSKNPNRVQQWEWGKMTLIRIIFNYNISCVILSSRINTGMLYQHRSKLKIIYYMKLEHNYLLEQIIVFNEMVNIRIPIC